MTGYVFSISIVAVVSYTNVDTQKEFILNDNKSKGGVYCWTHLESGKSM